MRVYLAPIFIRKINAALVIQAGKLRVKTDSEKMGQTDLLDNHSFRYSEQVDLVAFGPCASNSAAIDHDFTSQLEEMDYIVPAGSPVNSCMVFQECCGDYATSFKSALRKARPDINWIFPTGMPDLGKNDVFWYDRVLIKFCQSLLNKHIL